MPCKIQESSGSGALWGCWGGMGTGLLRATCPNHPGCSWAGTKAPLNNFNDIRKQDWVPTGHQGQGHPPLSPLPALCLSLSHTFPTAMGLTPPHPSKNSLELSQKSWGQALRGDSRYSMVKQQGGSQGKSGLLSQAGHKETALSCAREGSGWTSAGIAP